jgi:hypothetical protein
MILDIVGPCDRELIRGCLWMSRFGPVFEKEDLAGSRDVIYAVGVYQLAFGRHIQ